MQVSSRRASIGSRQAIVVTRRANHADARRVPRKGWVPYRRRRDLSETICRNPVLRPYESHLPVGCGCNLVRVCRVAHVLPRGDPRPTAADSKIRTEASGTGRFKGGHTVPHRDRSLVGNHRPLAISGGGVTFGNAGSPSEGDDLLGRACSPPGFPCLHRSLDPSVRPHTSRIEFRRSGPGKFRSPFG